MTMLPIAIAQLRPRKGAYDENIGRLGAIFQQAAALETTPRVLIAPETLTSGYFVEGGVREVAVTAGTLFEDLSAVHRESGAPPIDVAVGFYERWRNNLFNSAIYASLGGSDLGIRHVHRKIFLPTYGVFDESRFVGHGSSVHGFDTAWGRVALVICEDAWHSIVPSLAALDGAQVLFVVSASPAWDATPNDELPGQPGNVARWRRLAGAAATEHGIFVVIAHLVGFEGGKAFPGCSLVVGPDGTVVAEGALFQEELITANLDLEAITHARADQPLLADLRQAWPALIKAADTPRMTVDYDPPERPALVLTETTEPAAKIALPRPSAGPTLDIDPELVRRWLVAFLRDELVDRRKFHKGIVGLSGGVDSALTAFLAAEALGPENVLAVRMPYRTSSQESLDHAQLVVDALGIRCETVDITAPVDGYLDGAPDADPTRRGNVMARQRMIVLFDLSARESALPLGTGNKTERLLGYFTWHADDSPPVNPLGDLFKTQVWKMAAHVGVPDAIIEKPATADLVQGQTDEGDLGVAYSLADQILVHLLSGASASRITAMGFDSEAVHIVDRRLRSTHWKRRLPTTAMISRSAIGEYYLRPVDY